MNIEIYNFIILFFKTLPIMLYVKKNHINSEFIWFFINKQIKI
jgi:hypothetical protein